MVKTLLWLDDYRNPFDESNWLVFSPIPHPFTTIWVTNYNEFVSWITTNGLPDAICFDHDLSDFQIFASCCPELMKDVPWPEHEKTGMDCVKWLVDYCMDNQLPLPLYNFQTANPVGKENMKSYLDNYIKISSMR